MEMRACFLEMALETKHKTLFFPKSLMNPSSRQCRVAGCECEPIARDLCWRHYQHWRRHSRDVRKPEADGQAMPVPSHSYDQRFVGLFLDELSRRNSPRYPESRSFTALTRADYEFKHLGPLKPLPTGHSLSGHNHYPETSGVTSPGFGCGSTS
jgi:hypothetical protein